MVPYIRIKNADKPWAKLLSDKKKRKKRAISIKDVQL